MNLDSFLAHYQLTQNPFDAEEARHDPVFGRLSDRSPLHPDFPKVLGRLDRPSTAVVFGEKGSGKTAIRLLVGQRVAEHNQANPEERVLIVAYDDFNPVLDNLLRHQRQDAEKVLSRFRLEDHQDAILSLAVTKINNALLGRPSTEEPAPLPNHVERVLRRMPRQPRADLAVLSALYDQPRTGSLVTRWHEVKRKLRLGWTMRLSAWRNAALALTVIALALGVAVWWLQPGTPVWLWAALVVAGLGAIGSWGYWAWRSVSLWRLAHQVRREMPAINRSPGELRRIFSELRAGDLTRQPLPTPAGGDTASDIRYQLTRRLMDMLSHLGYVGMIVLVDRVDEPTLVSGDADRMKDIVWPMFDNKFLQQERLGLKLLLPIELRHQLHRESSEFFQEARLDKQNLIDRLTWSGATLYDLCSSRMNTCREAGAEHLELTSLFEEEVTRSTLVDALDQMHQPRDAFKFLYQVIQEHCRMVPEEEANFHIARLTLESVRKDQSRRVQELYRGLTPA